MKKEHLFLLLGIALFLLTQNQFTGQAARKAFDSERTVVNIEKVVVPNLPNLLGLTYQNSQNKLTGYTVSVQGVLQGVNTNFAPSPEDLDNDGDLDMFIPTFTALGCAITTGCPLGTNAPDFILINNGLGDMIYINSIPQDFDPTMSGAIGDVNGDGLKDIIKIGSYYSFVQPYCGTQDKLLINTGAGNFVDGTLTGASGPAGCIGTVCIYPVAGSTGLPFDQEIGGNANLGDVDNDGDLDLFITNAMNVGLQCPGATGQNRLYKNDGQGYFTDVTFGPGAGLPNIGKSTIFGKLADLDNDGDLDIVQVVESFINNIFVIGSSEIQILKNDGQGLFTIQSGATPSFSGIRLTLFDLADFDNDNDLDIVLNNIGSNSANYPGVGHINFLKNNGNGIFTLQNTLTVNSYTPKAADIDNDGDQDVFVSWFTQTSPFGGIHSILKNQGNFNFIIESPYPTFFMSNGLLFSGIIDNLGDLDLDGDKDLVLTRTGNAIQTVRAFENILINPPIDNISPTVSFISPLNNDFILGSSQTNVQIDAQDNTLVTHVDLFKVLGTSSPVMIGTTFTSPSNLYIIPWNHQGETSGLYTLVAVAFDIMNNAGLSSITVTVDMPPTVTITNPANGATVSGQITVTATATDNNIVQYVDFYRSAPTVSQVLVCHDTSAPYSCNMNTNPWPSGANTITARAFDLFVNPAGGSGSQSSATSITVYH